MTFAEGWVGSPRDGARRPLLLLTKAVTSSARGSERRFSHLSLTEEVT